MSDSTRRPGIPRPIPVVALFTLAACSSVDELNDFLSDIDVDFDASGDATGTDTDLDAAVDTAVPDIGIDATPDAEADTDDTSSIEDATADADAASDAADASGDTASDAPSDTASDTAADAPSDTASDTTDDAASDATSDADAGPVDAFALISEALESFVRFQCDGQLACNPSEFQMYYASVDACVAENMYQAEYFAETAESPEDCAAAIDALADCAETHSICAGEGETSYFEISYADCADEFDAQYYACYSAYSGY